MTRNATNAGLQRAKKSKSDEFYTRLEDIERELRHYRAHFRDKVVFCNCDDPRKSNFVKFFVREFRTLGLKKLIAACYHDTTSDPLPPSVGSGGFCCEYTAAEAAGNQPPRLTPFRGNGDFRGEESIRLLRQADIVVTNPPFSLFREYVAQLIAYEKKFLIIGNINAITYKEIFALIQANKAWLGVNLGRGIAGFIVPEHYELYGTETHIDEAGNRIISPNNCLWLTNLETAQRHEPLALTKQYRGNEIEYPTYDNCHGIHVDKTRNIPADYSGCMGVPITFLHKFNPAQFEIVKFRKGDDGKDLSINGKCPYFRILIKHKQLQTI